MIIQGIPSGDLECWCLLVTKEVFTKLRGQSPDEEFDVGRFAKDGSKYRYMVYPGDLIGHELNNQHELVEISFDVKKVKE